MDKPSPYVGPRAYRAGEELFGRDEETRDLLRLILAERIVLLYSPSGAGKTSLLTAKLSPALEQEEFHVLRPARVVGSKGSRASSGSVNSYVASLIHYWEEGRPPDTAPLTDLGGVELNAYLTQRSWLRNHGRSNGDHPTSTFLLLDQFEEILTQDPWDCEAKREFFRQLGVALHDRDLWALIAMREEHIAGLDAYLDLLPTRLASRYRLDLLSRDKARQAIAEPAGSVGVTYRPEALDKLIDELTAVRACGAAPSYTTYVEPVHLQVACERLWQRLPNGATEVSARLVDSAGTVGEALAAYYRDAVHGVAQTPEARQAGCEEKQIRDWFENDLITQGGLRDQIQRGGTTTGSLPNDVVDALEARYLLRFEARRGTAWYEIAHDRLIEAIKADNLRWYETQDVSLRLLRDHVKKWQEHQAAGRSGRVATDLLTGEQLEQVETWAAANPNSLSAADRSFLAACRERQKRRRALLVGGSVVVAGALLGLLVVLWQNLLIERNTRELRVHTLLSDSAFARWRRDDHELAALLALQAERTGEEDDAQKLNPRIQDTLLGVAQLRPFVLSPQVPPPRERRGHSGKLAYARDGKWLAFETSDDKIEVVSLAGEGQSRILGHSPGALRSLEFSPSGTYLVAVTESGFELFPVAGLAGVTPRSEPMTAAVRGALPTAVSGAFCLAERDSRLFVAHSDGHVMSWDVGDSAATAAVPPLFATHPGGSAPTAMACDPEGRWVALGDGKGRISLLATTASAGPATSSVLNAFERWPDDVKQDFRRSRDNLDVGVSALIPDGEHDRLIAVFRHGPIGLMPLTTLAGAAPSLTYLRPARDSVSEVRGGGTVVRRVNKSMIRKPKLTRAAFDQATNQLVVGGESTVGVWDLRRIYDDPEGKTERASEAWNSSGTVFAAYKELRGAPNAGVSALSILDEGKRIAATDVELHTRSWLLDGLGRITYASRRLEMEEVGDVPSVLHSIGFLPDGQALAVAGSAYLTFLPTEDSFASGDGANGTLPGSFRSLSISPDGRWLALAARKRGTPPPAETGQTPPNEPNTGVWLTANPRQTGAGRNEESRGLNLPSGADASAVAWAVQPALLAAGDSLGNVWLWSVDPTMGIQPATAAQPLFTQPSSAVWALAFHPTQPWLAVGTDAGLEIWRLDTAPDGHFSGGARLANSQRSEHDSVRALAFSPDGKTLVVGNDSGSLAIVPTQGWSSDSWREAASVFAHSMGVTSLAFCNGPPAAGLCEPTVLASAGNDGSVKLWRVSGEEGSPQAQSELTLTGPSAEALSVAFSPNGKLIAAGDADGQIHLWRRDLRSVVNGLCGALHRNLTREEWSRSVGKTVPYECTCPNLPPAFGIDPKGALNCDTS